MTAIQDTSDAFLSALHALWARITTFLPDVLGALLIIAAGYLIARLIGAAITRVTKVAGLDRFAETQGIASALGQTGIERPMSEILGRIAFWTVMLLFFVSAIDRLGLGQVSAALNAFVMYLPKVIGAAFIMMAGLFIAQMVRRVIAGSAETMGLEFASPLATTAYVVLVVIAAALAIGQLDLETEILYDVISITLMSAGAAAAIAFGLGSKEVAANVLAGTYIREMFREGDHVRIGDVEGDIKFVGPVKTVITNDRGDLSIANGELMRAAVQRTR